MSTPTPDAAWIESAVADAMASDRVPGIAVSIVAAGTIVYAGGFGVSSVEECQPVTADTLFRIGSITKPLTATVVVRLASQGVVDLDDAVAAYVPWLRLPGGIEQRVTLRDLLSHGSGLPNDVIGDGTRDPGGLESFVRNALPRMRPVDADGAVYSNPGYALAGFVAEQASGRPFARLLTELVCRPFGMSRTTLDPMVAMTYPLAQSHELDGAEVRVQHRFDVNTAYGPAGLAFSTAVDLAAFAVAHLRGDDALPRDVASGMHEVQKPHRDGGTAGFGLGFEVYTQRNGRDTVAHSGNVGGFWGVLAMVPSRQAAVVVLCNRTPGFRLPSLPYRILDALLGLPSPWPPMRTWPGADRAAT